MNVLVVASMFCLLFCQYAAARKVTTTVVVRDEEGVAVSGAVVGVSASLVRSDGWGSTLHYKEAITDTSGVVQIRQRCDSFVIAGAKKPGYYESNSGQVLTRAVADGGRVANTNPTIFLPIRVTGNPIPMYACQLSGVNLPKLNEPCSFDLLVRDWVEPLGRGTVTDLTVVARQQFSESGKQTGDTLSVTFPNPSDGVVRVPDEQVIWQSTFVLPREAPADGYTNRVERWRNWGSDHGYLGNERDDSGYFLRIRSVTESGSVLRALYGKIRGDFRFSARPAIGTPSIGFQYYVNPEPNSRNIEFDPKKNLFQGLKDMEAVYQP